MTLQIDSDFRTLLTGPAQEPRVRSSQPGGGAAGFADSLLRADQSETDDNSGRQIPDAAAGQTAASAVLVNLAPETEANRDTDQVAGQIAGQTALSGDEAAAMQQPPAGAAEDAPAVAADTSRNAHAALSTDAISSHSKLAGDDTVTPDTGVAAQQVPLANAASGSADATAVRTPAPEEIADDGSLQVTAGPEAIRSGPAATTPSPAQQAGSTEPARRTSAGTRAENKRDAAEPTAQPVETTASSVDAQSAPSQAGQASLQALAGQAVTATQPTKPGAQAQQDSREGNVSAAQGVAGPGGSPNAQQAPRAVARAILTEKADDAASADGTKTPAAAAKGFETALAAVTPSDAGASAATTLANTTPAPAAQAANTVAPAAQTPLSMVPTHAVVTATPADVTTLINDHMASSHDKSDRIVVQLDPPELGRISIDFRFDGQGLQHVTITGERPEALQQLRLMHHDLVQTLERNGLSGDSMSYQQQSAGHQNPQGNQPRATATASTPAALADAEADAPAIVSPRKPQQTAMSGSGLDIRL